MKHQSNSETYKAAGVDIEAGYEAVERMQKHIKRTMKKGQSFDSMGFGGLLDLPVNEYKNPCLISSTDGVGTKLKLAFLMDKHDTVGIDLVAMCVNDVLCAGAKPINFLDYIACGKNDPVRIEEIVKGICDGCVEAGVPLVGGETAEMPGFYPEDEYDLAGFCNGIVEKDRIIDKGLVKEGDVLIGLASSGVHSNGFSLVRKVFDIRNKEVLDKKYPILDGKSLGECLLEPTKIYVKPILKLLDEDLVKSLAHITGGGFYENIPRSLPDDLAVEIVKDKIRILPIFKLIQEIGEISDKDMFNTFNMGIGMTLVAGAENLEEIFKILDDYDISAYEIGRVIRSEIRVNFI